LRDPRTNTWYQAIVHRVKEGKIDLDLRGDPVPRVVWERILEDAWL
jgi:hypothetical protein